MKSSAGTSLIKTGFSDFDRLFESEGIPHGSVCLIRSSPKASGFKFLLSVAQKNMGNSHYITTTHSARVISNSLKGMKTNSSEIPEVREIDPRTATDVLTAVNEMELESGDVVILDSINCLVDSKRRELLDMYRGLKRVAVEQGAVLVLHEVTADPHQSTPSFVDLEYMSDLLFGITVTMSDEGIFQNLWVERLPVNVSLKESKKKNRIITMLDTGGRVTINTGGSI